MLTGTSLVSWARLLAVTTISARAESSSAAVVAASAMGAARLRAASKAPTHHGPWPDARGGGIGAAISSNCGKSLCVSEDESICLILPCRGLLTAASIGIGRRWLRPGRSPLRSACVEPSREWTILSTIVNNEYCVLPTEDQYIPQTIHPNFGV